MVFVVEVEIVRGREEAGGVIAARAVAESLQQWGNFLFYHISFSGFFGASGGFGN